MTLGYSPGGADPAMNRIRSDRRREREKREANRPTGTEIGQVTRKLQELTEQLKVAQDQLAAQQATLQAQQTEMIRRTPEPHGGTQSTPSAQAGTTPTTIHTYSISIPSGKTQAFVSLSATASTTDSGATPFLEIYEDGTLVSLMTIPNILPANGLSFSQTVSGNHSYTVRVATGTGSAAVRNITSWFTVIYYV